MSRLLPLVFALALVSAGCRRSGPPRQPPIAEAYTGPATLKLRKEIPLESPVSVVVKHGDRLEIIQRRRRFMKVRAPNGAEGWTQDNFLLSSEEMEALRALGRAAADMPSHGVATTFDLLNVHTLPARQSPSFTQMKQGDKMQVLAHVVAPRTAPPRKPLIPPPPKKVRPRKKPPEGRVPPPPRAAPPGPPANWLELSKTDLPPEPPPEPKPVPQDDWSLIRTPGGQAGWVLTRRLFMAIPDEVAQYAEGARITSYFSLGDVNDEGQVRHNWLWTTIGSGLQSYDFDSFRVFIWSLRRHRYETAYIERRLTGYFPVKLQQVQLGSSARGAPAIFPGFGICVQKEDGQRVQKNFAFIVNVVRYAGESACAAPPAIPLPWNQPAPEVAGAPQPVPVRAPQPATPSLLSRIKAKYAELTNRFRKK